MEPALPRGAFYMLVEHKRADDVTAMKELLARGVAMAPGIPFFADQSKSSGYIRVHFTVSRDTVQRVREKLLTPDDSRARARTTASPSVQRLRGVS